MLRYIQMSVGLLLLWNASLSAEPGHYRENHTGLSITMTAIPGYSDARGWKLNVIDDGRADLRVRTITRYFRVPPKQISEFKALLIRSSFFGLPLKIGHAVPDDGWSTMAITLGNRNKTITLFSSFDGLATEQRALRIWDFARNWFNDPGIGDERPQHQRILRMKIKS